jgi:hypothetical protein
LDCYGVLGGGAVGVQLISYAFDVLAGPLYRGWVGVFILLEVCEASKLHVQAALQYVFGAIVEICGLQVGLFYFYECGAGCVKAEFCEGILNYPCEEVIHELLLAALPFFFTVSCQLSCYFELQVVLVSVGTCIGKVDVWDGCCCVCFIYEAVEGVCVVE